MTFRLATVADYEALQSRLRNCAPPAESPAPRPALPKVDRMNKLEGRYAREVLEVRKRDGIILSWHFEAVKLRLADRTGYTPDFMVCYPDRIEFHETKGFWRDDARVKIKVAAELFPMFKFIAVQWSKKAGGWMYEAF